MDTLTFISNIVGSLAWPAAFCVAVLLLRRPLAELIPAIRSLEYKGFKVEFEKELEKVAREMDAAGTPAKQAELPADVATGALPKSWRELINSLSDLSPNAAILESWRNVERTLDYYFKTKGIKRPVSGQSIIGHLDYDPNFPPQLVSAYQELRLLRNRAAHEQEQITAKSAKDFAELADRLALALVNAANSQSP